MDEHSKLARVALDIPPEADAAFRTNVSKMSGVLPSNIRGELRALLSGVVTRAQEAYRIRVRLVESQPRGAADLSDYQPIGPRWALSDHWPVIASVLERELGDQPDTLRRVLLALSNADPRAVPANETAEI
jgi:hypothetical protein